MRKTFKKSVAFLLAMAMMLTMSFSVMAAGETIEFAASKTSIYSGNNFEVSVTISAEMAEFRGGQIFLKYDSDVIVPSDGTNALTAWNNSVFANSVHSSAALGTWTIMNGRIAANSTEGAADAALSFTLAPVPGSGAEYFPVTNNEIEAFTFNFKAVAPGTTTIALATTSNTQFDGGNAQGAAVRFSPTATPLSVVVQAMPVDPTITNATVVAADEQVGLRAGAKAKASYVWDNGNQSDDPTVTGDPTSDISEINWKVGGEAVTPASNDARDELTLTADMVGKTISYSVVPKADRPADLNNAVTTAVESAESTVVKAASNYAESFTAEVEADFTDEITAKKAVNVTVTLDDTYQEAAIADTTVISWYVLPAVAEGEDDYTVETAKGASLEGITPVTGATATFDVANKDQWVVVVVAPKATIAGEEFTAAEVKLAAKISGEPPELAEGAEAAIAKLAAKKYFTSSTPDATTVKFVSKVAADIENVDPEYIGYTYAWYLTDAAQTADNFNAESATAITAEDALKTPGKVKLSKVENAENKFLNVVITATDDLDIFSSVTVCFTNPIKKATGGSGTQGGASLVTGTQGGTVVEPEKPGTDEPAVDEKNPQDPAGEANDKGASVFTDVDKEVYAWGYDYLDKLAKAGVVKGMTETTYAPEEETTYAQFTALVVRVLGLTAEEAATEKVAADHWSFAEVSVADKLGILADVAFDADKAITREDMAAIAHKALVAKAVELKAGEAVEYTDASAISEYAAAAIDAMSKAGILNGMGDGTFAPKGTTTRMQTAKVIGMISELIG